MRIGSEVCVPRESYVHGNSGPPLIGKTIGALLDEVSATDGSREALVVAHQKIRWTYSELKSRSDAFASGLLSLGLEPGDRVGICAPNCAEWTIAQFATAKAGLILVNINPAYRLSELEHALRSVGCRTLQDERLYRNDPRACPRAGKRKRRVEELAPPGAATRYLDRREARWLPGIRLDPGERQASW